MNCMHSSSIVLFIAFVLVGVHICIEEISDPKSSSQSRRFTEEDRKYLKDNGLDPDSLSPDTVIIKPPSYTDEEESSVGMPKAYRCDGCRVISYQVIFNMKIEFDFAS